MKNITLMSKIKNKKTNKEIRHDLKSPLTVISGYAQLIMKKYKDTDSKEERWSKEVFNQVNKLVNMIDQELADNIDEE